MEANLNDFELHSEKKKELLNIKGNELIEKTFLNMIDSPDDLKGIKEEYLRVLCEEIREFLIDNVTKTGGHLGSNLGVVEITTALHYVFNFLEDALIFDVSHQSYVHKVLTGRRNMFNTLRQFKGMSGFTNKNESRYDHFTFGHAGSSISVALGMAEYMNEEDTDKTVVVLIGDASISTGMSFEALNHLGQTEGNVLIILNDNEMSISPTVGSLGKYLTKSRTNPKYLTLKEKLSHFINRISPKGKGLYKFLENIKEDIKHLFIPRSIFEDLSIPYYGPIDGHDINTLIPTIRDLKKKKGPKLLHIYTQKGKGMPNLDNEPTKYHSAPKKAKKSPDYIPYTEVFGKTLLDMGRKDNKIRGITAAMPDGTGTIYFQKEFPERFYDVGICEQHAVGIASGLATKGLKPVCAIYSTFLQRAFDQVFHEVCLQNLPVVFALDRAGLVGGDGPTHHGVFDIAILRTLPNIVLCAPKDNYELREMLRFLIRLNRPSAIRYPRTESEVPKDYDEGFVKIELGRAEVLQESENAHISIIAYGSMVEIAKKTVNILKEQGIYANLVNMRFVKPIDENILSRYADKNIPIVTLEEHSLQGGFGTAVLESLSSNNKNKVKVHNIGIPDFYIEHGKREELLNMLGLDAESVSEKIKSYLK